MKLAVACCELARLSAHKSRLLRTSCRCLIVRETCIRTFLFQGCLQHSAYAAVTQVLEFTNITNITNTCNITELLNITNITK